MTSRTCFTPDVPYIRGCMEKSKEISNKKALKPCVTKANIHVRENIIFILDQDGSKAKE